MLTIVQIRNFILSIGFLILILPLLHSQKVPPVLDHISLGKAKRSSKFSKKLVFAYVYTEWSVPSMRMMDSTFTDQKVIDELSSDYENVAIDASRKKQFAQEYHIHIYPTMLVMDWEGTVLIRAKGYKTPLELLKTIEKTRSNSRYLRQSIDSILHYTNRSNILQTIDSVKYYRDDYAATNLAKKYLDRKNTDWRDPVHMALIKDYFNLDKKYLRFISKYHFKFYEHFDSLEIKENIAFHVFLNSVKTDKRGRAQFNYKPVRKWFRKHRILGADKLENFVKIKHLLWGRGPSIKYSVNLLKDYPETTDENVLYASAIRLLISNTRRRIDYDELIISVRSSIKEDGTFWRYDLLSLLYHKVGNTSKSTQAIETAKAIAASTNKLYDPTLPYLKDALEKFK